MENPFGWQKPCSPGRKKGLLRYVYLESCAGGLELDEASFFNYSDALPWSFNGSCGNECWFIIQSLISGAGRNSGEIARSVWQDNKQSAIKISDCLRHFSASWTIKAVSCLGIPSECLPSRNYLLNLLRGSLWTRRVGNNVSGHTSIHAVRSTIGPVKVNQMKPPSGLTLSDAKNTFLEFDTCRSQPHKQGSTWTFLLIKLELSGKSKMSMFPGEMANLVGGGPWGWILFFSILNAKAKLCSRREA